MVAQLSRVTMRQGVHAKARAERDPDGGRVMVFGGDGEGGGRGSGYRKTSDEKIPPLRKKPPGKRPSGKQPADWRRYDALVVADGQSVWEGRHRVVVLYGHANEDGDQIPFEDDGTVEDAIEELPKDPPRPGSEPVPVYVEVCKLAAATPDPKRNIAKYLKDRLPGERFVVYGYDCWISPQGNEVVEMSELDPENTPKRGPDNLPIPATPKPIK